MTTDHSKDYESDVSVSRWSLARKQALWRHIKDKHPQLVEIYSNDSIVQEMKAVFDAEIYIPRIIAEESATQESQSQDR